ncbi:metallophosphoesterase [Senegalimassilia anaerobia]|uniref:metallophosphoesterase n=1 Tax=Senegalimassilia anaerobia TaxID=1473216 RepID=UPI003A8D1133
MGEAIGLMSCADGENAILPLRDIRDAESWSFLERSLELEHHYIDPENLDNLAMCPDLITEIPKSEQTQEQADIVIPQNGDLLCDISSGLVSESLACQALKNCRHPLRVFGSIPKKILTEQLCVVAASRVGANALCLKKKKSLVPKEFITDAVLKAGNDADEVLEQERERRLLSSSGDQDDSSMICMRGGESKRGCGTCVSEDSNIGYCDLAHACRLLDRQIVNEEQALVPADNVDLLKCCYDTGGCGHGNSARLYYISDLHIEHQLSFRGCDSNEGDFAQGVNMLASELARSFDACVEYSRSLEEQKGNTTGSTFLVFAGDVSDSLNISDLFFRSFVKKQGPQAVRVTVLGNHEYLEAGLAGISGDVDTIAARYKAMFEKHGVHLLHNSVLAVYKDGRRLIELSEKQLVSMDAAELTAFFAKCSFLVFGGTGFSGRNEIRNAKANLYGGVVPTFDADIGETKRFLAIHNKIAVCAGICSVVVVTHTPPSDWCPPEDIVRGWTYVSGHTHINGIDRLPNNAVSIHGNQIGYQNVGYSFKSVDIACSYDPFESLCDGVYRISRQQYLDFNAGRGIYVAETKRVGAIYCLKRSGVYMFVSQIKGKHLCLLDGGARKTLPVDDLSYYWNHLKEYAEKVAPVFQPVRDALDVLSKEVKAFGGSGLIHGFIVDVDFYRHIQLDPFTGHMDMYWSSGMSGRYVCDGAQELLELEGFGFIKKNELLLNRFNEAKNAGLLPVLSGRNQLAQLNDRYQVDLKTGYERSRIMKKVQYLIDYGVVRIWNTQVLEPSKKTQILKPPKKRVKRTVRKKTPEQKARERAVAYCDAISNLSENSIEVNPDDYMGSRFRVKAKCLKCGNEWEPRADHLKDRCWCPCCKKKNN